MKNLIIYALIGVIACLSWNVYKLGRKQDIQVKSPPLSENTIKAEEISRKVDKEGAEHVIYKEAEPIIKLIELKIEDKTKVDSLIKLAGIKEKQLKSIQNVVANVSQENIQLKRVLNTITKDTVFAYQDKYLDLSFRRQSDSVTFANFAYNFDFNSVQYWKRDWFLGAKKSYVDIWSSDPRVKIRGVERLQIRQIQPQYGLRMQGHAVWDPKSGEVGYGPALRIDADRFSFQGTYTYYPSARSWRPSVSGNFDVFRF